MNSSHRPHLLAACLAAALLALPLAGRAQTLPPPAAPAAAPTPALLSAGANPPQAPWLQRLTLGAGDTVNLSLFESPELTQSAVLIGPDGRLGYLEAQDVMAAGLTIDELRQKLDDELGRFRRSPRTIVTPASFQSKKYYVLGQVVGQGVFTLDRPMTVIEAVARARGLTSATSRGRMTDFADLSRSFLVRQGQRVPVNFEELFARGDLSHNAQLQPGDYLYFPAPSEADDVYVLGEVTRAGIAPYAPRLGAVAAITARGGFSDRAWKGKVLVLRGSIDRPETFVVNVNDVLAARTPDLVLQPNDIVYVSARPWIRAEELLDTAASAFVQAAVVIWTGERIYDTFRQPTITTP